jgi:hypothetical protein
MKRDAAWWKAYRDRDRDRWRKYERERKQGKRDLAKSLRIIEIKRDVAEEIKEPGNE